MNPIRVLLAEDHTIVRKGLQALLNGQGDIEVVGEAEDGFEVVNRSQELHPDVIVMDISMPNLSGLEATRQIKKLLPEIKVLILSVHTSEEYIFQTLRAGASGYVVKKAAPEELITAIYSISQGETYLSPAVSKVVVEEYVHLAGEERREDSLDRLTAREREVLQLIAEGNTTREAAKKLFISVKTVETHRSRLMSKLDIHGIAGLTKFAIGRGLISGEL
ncbi:MAG: response regulator transcription factor [Candidatus Neomarinimicrobiota bacterium]